MSAHPEADAVPLLSSWTHSGPGSAPCAADAGITITNADGLKAAVAASGTLTVEGSLRYQACDDTRCYIPETLPVTWTLKVGTLDATRAPAELRRK